MKYFISITLFFSLCYHAFAEDVEILKRPLTWSINSIAIEWTVEQDIEKNVEICISGISQNENHITTGEELVVTSNGGITVNGVIEGGIGVRHASSHIVESRVKDTEIHNKIQELKKQKNYSAPRWIFTVHFKNHTNEDFIMDTSTASIPVFINDKGEYKHMGDAKVKSPNGQFVIFSNGKPHPCKFQLPIDSTFNGQIYYYIPLMDIEGSQLGIYNSSNQDMVHLSYFTVGLHSLENNTMQQWEITYSPQITLRSALQAIDKNNFVFSENGSLEKVNDIPLIPTSASDKFILVLKDGKPIEELKNFHFEKNSILKFLIVPRFLLEETDFKKIRENFDKISTLLPFRNLFNKWVEDGALDRNPLDCIFENHAKVAWENIENAMNQCDNTWEKDSISNTISFLNEYQSLYPASQKEYVTKLLDYYEKLMYTDMWEFTVAASTQYGPGYWTENASCEISINNEVKSTSPIQLRKNGKDYLNSFTFRSSLFRPVDIGVKSIGQRNAYFWINGVIRINSSKSITFNELKKQDWKLKLDVVTLEFKHNIPQKPNK